MPLAHGRRFAVPPYSSSASRQLDLIDGSGMRPEQRRLAEPHRRFRETGIAPRGRPLGLSRAKRQELTLTPNDKTGFDGA